MNEEQLLTAIQHADRAYFDEVEARLRDAESGTPAKTVITRIAAGALVTAAAVGAVFGAARLWNRNRPIGTTVPPSAASVPVEPPSGVQSACPLENFSGAQVEMFAPAFAPQRLEATPEMTAGLYAVLREAAWESVELETQPPDSQQCTAYIHMNGRVTRLTLLGGGLVDLTASDGSRSRWKISASAETEAFRIITGETLSDLPAHLITVHELPDLAEFGIDTAGFAQSESPYLYSPFGMGDWVYDGEKPVAQWVQYQNEAGALFAFDDQGRLRKFNNSADIAVGSGNAGDPLSAVTLRQRALQIMERVTPDFDTFTVDKENTLIDPDSTACMLFLKREYAPGCRDIAGITLRKDGQVRSFEIAYADVTAEEAAQLENVMARWGWWQRMQTDYQADRYSVEGRSYAVIGGRLLGFYAVTAYLPADGGESVHASENVITCMERTD